MEVILLCVFILGYLGITLEHTIKIDKLVPALSMMAILWALIALAHLPVFEVDTINRALKPTHIEEILLHHLGKTAEILIFLIGAMTIVEIIDYFDGFSSLKKVIRTRKKFTLLIIISVLAFFLSAIIDNLTATIVLITILRKLISDTKLRVWYASMIILAANSGGAWSPIGDVTTTMLWIGDKVTTTNLIGNLFIPSLVCATVPIVAAYFIPAFKGSIDSNEDMDAPPKSKFGTTMLVLGLISIVFVPVFKTVTHLPPYVGMMLSLSIVTIFAEFYSRTKFSVSDLGHGASSDGHGHESPVHKALTKIELPSILFFLGILLAVGALESLGMLFNFADTLNASIPNTNVVVMIFGVASAIIDNVPLVAASMGMFSQPLDDSLWHFIAYAAGTGGSMLIIGSAAGVVAMGMEKIDFFWYLKKISWLAILGFLAGAGTFLILV